MQIIENANISQLTTLRIGGNADQLFIPKTIEELLDFMHVLKMSHVNWFVLGGGSNSLVSSEGVKGAVISMSALNWFKQISEDSVLIGAGMKMPKLAGLLAQLGLSGCEFMEGIPGTVGGAVIMNAGAHGQWTSGVLQKVKFLDTLTGQIVIIPATELEFGYRSSKINTKRYIILEVEFKLNKDQTNLILERMKLYSKQRNLTQPKGFSSGCIFRNPSPDLPAGKLIDQMGFKGQIFGGAEISNIHGNFIMNSQFAKSQEICYLINQIQEQAWNSKKIWLQPEVCAMGEFSEQEKLIWIHPEKRTNINTNINLINQDKLIIL